MNKEIDIMPFIDYMLGLCFLVECCKGEERAKAVVDSPAFKKWTERAKNYERILDR